MWKYYPEQIALERQYISLKIIQYLFLEQGTRFLAKSYDIGLIHVPTKDIILKIS